MRPKSGQGPFCHSPLLNRLLESQVQDRFKADNDSNFDMTPDPRTARDRMCVYNIVRLHVYSNII